MNVYEFLEYIGQPPIVKEQLTEYQLGEIFVTIFYMFGMILKSKGGEERICNNVIEYLIEGTNFLEFGIII